MALSVFLDTSVLLAGLVDLGPQSAPAQSIMHAVARRRFPPRERPDCCLEFYSVATRLPPEFRLTPADAGQLVEQEVFARMSVHDLPVQQQIPMLRTATRDATIGGRISDVHIAEVARTAGARVVVTDNRRHFLSALRYGLRVEDPSEFLSALRARK